jgi:small subunit ribosomal protein S4e
MVMNHLKRLKAPKTWTVLRKVNKFITRPNPGAHKLDLAVSINTFLKELTNLTKTTRETKYLLTKLEVQINGKRRRDEKHQVGLFDVVTIPSSNLQYILTLNEKGKLVAKETKQNETLLKIVGRTMIGKDKVQINTLTGYNLLFTEKNAKNYKRGDTLVVSLPDLKVKEHLTRQKDMFGIIYLGKHSGTRGNIVNMEENLVSIQEKDKIIKTNREYVFIVGKTKPSVEL